MQFLYVGDIRHADILTELTGQFNKARGIITIGFRPVPIPFARLATIAIDTVRPASENHPKYNIRAAKMCELVHQFSSIHLTELRESYML
jgi:hypothetical protein